MPETTASNTDSALVDAIERDLNDVDVAMDRLEKGTYFSDEITGAPLQTDFLTTNPLVRRNK
jgi:RNA polymerase-binding transcription factor DksA